MHIRCDDLTSLWYLVGVIVGQEPAAGGGHGRLDGPGDRLQLRVGRAGGQALGVHGHLLTAGPPLVPISGLPCPTG